MCACRPSFRNCSKGEKKISEMKGRGGGGGGVCGHAPPGKIDTLRLLLVHSQHVSAYSTCSSVRKSGGGGQIS